MRRPRPGLVFLLLTGLLVGARPARGEEPEVLEDKDYCFQVRSPGTGWRLLPEAEAQRLVPDALAGLVGLSKGTFGVVIAEELPDADLDGMVTQLQANVELEDLVFGTVETLEYQGFPARRWSTSGVQNGVKARLRHLVFFREPCVFQLVAFTLGDKGARASDAELDTLARQLLLTEGTVRPRRTVATTADTHGLGWRIQGGVYQDAANGIEVRPPEGWRLAVGFELASMNGSACVGLVASAPEVYLVVIVERARNVESGPFLKALSDGFTEDGMEPVGAPVAETIGGRKFAMQRYRKPGALPITLHYGARLDEGRAVQVQAWYVRALEARALPLVRAAFTSLRFLPEPERKALEEELRPLADPQNAVGPAYSLRQGTYRDFEHGIVWTKPAGFWKVLAGQEARAVNEDATLSFEAPALGVQGLIIAEELSGADPREFHRTLVERLEPKDRVPTPREEPLEGATALVSDVRPGILPHPFRYVVASTLKDGRAYQVLVWGLEGNMEAARDETLAAVRALRLPERLVAQERLANSVVDHRLGFRLRAPAGTGWRLSDLTPRGLAPMAALLGYEDRAGGVIGGAFCSLQEGQDAEVARNLVMEAIRAHHPEAKGPREETETTFRGRPARRFVLGESKRLVGWLVQRERTFYVVLLAKEPDAGRTPDEEAAALFEILD